MADTRKITIDIISKTTSAGNNQAEKATESTGEVKSDLTTLLHPIKTAESNTLGKNILVYQAYQQAKKAIVTSVNATFTRYYSLSEDYIGENNYKNTMTAISKVTGFGTSVIGGAIAGSQLGVVGAVAGAVIGAVGYGVTEYLSYNSKISSYYQNLNATNYQTSFQQTRAGLTNGGKGTEN